MVIRRFGEWESQSVNEKGHSVNIRVSQSFLLCLLQLSRGVGTSTRPWEERE